MERAASDAPAPSKRDRLGRYRLLMELGQGGMGTIHLAIATGTGDFRKLVVLKELREEHASDPVFVDMFMHEAMLAGHLNHANVVQTIEAARDGRRLFLAMEFLDGQPLLRILRQARDSSFSQRALLQLLCDALAGLHYAHELKDYGGNPLGIVHCDVSPHNIFVTYDGHVKVVDFGVAKARGSSELEVGFRGRLGYAAPEQLRGDPVDARADVFAMGVILWELLAGQRLVASGTPAKELVARRLSGQEPRIAHVVPTVPTELGSICDRAMQTSPDQRFASAEEFRQHLAAYVLRAGGPVESKELVEFMSASFGDERQVLHRLIHEHLEDEETSIKNLAVPFEPEIGNDDVTRVGDLSPLVDLTRSESDAELASGFRPKRTKWIAAVVGIFSVLVVAGWARWSARAPEVRERAAGDEPLLAADLLTSPVPVTTSAELIANGASASLSAQAALAPHTSASEADDGEDEPEAEAQTEPTEERGSKKRRSRRAASREGSGSAPANQASAEKPSEPAPAPPSNRPAPSIGEDLSKRPQERRQLDENPFR